MALHFYIDDSDDNAPGKRKAYVLGGYVASPESWAKFSHDWALLLEAFNVPRGKSGRRRFKMNEMARRMKDVKPFYETIVRHAIGAVSIILYEDDLERAMGRIWSDNVDVMFSPEADGKVLIKKLLISELHRLMAEPSILAVESSASYRFSDMLRGNRDRIELYFDEDSRSSIISDWWDGTAPDFDCEIRSGHPPQFLDDEVYLPLQAADFWAWWARRAYERKSIKDVVGGDFETWHGSEGPPFLSMSISEDDLVGCLIATLKLSAPFGIMPNLYDAKTKPRTDRAKAVHYAKKRSHMLSHFERLLRKLRGA